MQPGNIRRRLPEKRTEYIRSKIDAGKTAGRCVFCARGVKKHLWRKERQGFADEMENQTNERIGQYRCGQELKCREEVILSGGQDGKHNLA